jgi:hypothetical protein
MSPKTPSPMIATLFILGGTVFGVLGALHAVFICSICTTRATTCPCRSFGCTRDDEFCAQTIGRTHGHVASLDWL